MKGGAMRAIFTIPTRELQTLVPVPTKGSNFVILRLTDARHNLKVSRGGTRKVKNGQVELDGRARRPRN